MKQILLLGIVIFLASCAAKSTILPEQKTAPDIQAAQPSEQSIPQAKAGPSNVPNGGLSPSYSPDGSMIAFLSSTLHTPSDLWVMNADGSGAKRLTTQGVQGFRWSPDGKSIMITANRKGFEETLIVEIEAGAGEKRIPGLPPGASMPVYSPDGQLFAFTAPGEQKVRDLWMGTADGGRIEPVTEKMSVRDVFWSPDSRKVYYEVGASYGVGIWEMDLATMESKPLLSKYIGRPDYSEKAGLIAYAYPTNPGEFEVQTMKLDGSDIRSHKSPRLPGRWLLWDADGKGIYYLGQELEEVPPQKPTGESAKEPPEKRVTEEAEKPPGHSKSKEPDYTRTGVTALWHLNLETGTEKRVSPSELHLNEFSLFPEGKKMLLSGVLRDSYTSELFTLDLASGEMLRLAQSRASSWLPAPSRDSSRIAFFTNAGFADSLRVVSAEGEELAAYPGIILEGDTRLHWLPESEGLLLFSGRAVLAFTEKGEIEFPNKGDHRTLLYADVSIESDRVLLSAIPRFGETPGLYMLEAREGKFSQTDLRYPPRPEIAADVYMQPRWSFDGQKIAFSDGIDIWTMKSDGTKRDWITNYAENNREGKGKPSLATYPVWSVKGELLCYTLTVFDGKTILRQIWIMKADGSDRKMLFSEEMDSQFQAYQAEYTSQPFFDATDERVIFTAVDKGIPDIFSVHIRDGKVQRLTENGAIFPALLPEEGVIVYTSLEGNNEALWVMNSDGTGKHQFVIKESKESKPSGVETK